MNCPAKLKMSSNNPIALRIGFFEMTTASAPATASSAHA
jgi:hypothetical protein